MCVNSLWETQIHNKSKKFLLGETNGEAVFVLRSPGLIWCPLMKETETFSITVANIYWKLMYLTLCHLFYALPHCTLTRVLEIGTDIISIYRWGNQGLERWSALLNVIELVSGRPGSHTQLCVHRALLNTASSEIVIFPGGVRCGWVWRELLDQVLTEAYAVFWVCFEVASSALASLKASSPLGLGFMMWFPSFCFWRSSPPGSENPLAVDHLLCWSHLVLSLCSGWAMLVSQMWWCCEDLLSAVWFGFRGHALFTTLLRSPLTPVM